MRKKTKSNRLNPDVVKPILPALVRPMLTKEVKNGKLDPVLCSKIETELNLYATGKNNGLRDTTNKYLASLINKDGGVFTARVVRNVR